MKKIIVTIFVCTISITVMAQSENSKFDFQRDSALHAAIHKDSMKIVRQYGWKARFQRLLKEEEFPVINAGKFSGVFPVQNVTEVPDPSMQYKLLFESHQMNPDSLRSEPDENLVEIARKINLHVASGIPLKNISVVVILHGPAITTVSNNTRYKKMFERDNPNIKLIEELKKTGARFIVCGQSMDMGGLNKADLLSDVKISLTAQTVISGYQLKGYVLEELNNEGK